MHEILLASLRTDPIFYCRLRGSEGFRQQLLRRKGKLVLLTPPRAGTGVQEVAHYLKPMLTNCSRRFGMLTIFNASTSVMLVLCCGRVIHRCMLLGGLANSDLLTK